MKMTIDPEWLRRRIAEEPDDVSVEAGILHPEAPRSRLAITPAVFNAALAAFAAHPMLETDGEVEGPLLAALSAAFAAQARTRLPVHAEVEAYPLDAHLWKRTSTGEWVLELSGSINDTGFNIRHTQPGDLPPEDAVGLPTHYDLLAAAEDVCSRHGRPLDKLQAQVERNQPAPVIMPEGDPK